MAQPVRVVLLSLALTGCASAPPPYDWAVSIYSNPDYIPMQGLPAVPRVIAHDRPTHLVNFGNETERDKARRAAVATGAVAGGTQAAVVSMIVLAPACVLYPPLCIGVVAVGSASGAASSTVSTISAEEAAQFAAIFEHHATNATLGELVSQRMPKGRKRDYPRLVVRAVTVVLVPTHGGVRFRLAAEVQGFPEPGHAWKPSVHAVPFPIRPVADWLASDGWLLENDLQTALRALSVHIA